MNSGISVMPLLLLHFCTFHFLHYISFISSVNAPAIHNMCRAARLTNRVSAAWALLTCAQIAELLKTSIWELLVLCFLNFRHKVMLRTVVTVHHNKRLRCVSSAIGTNTPRAQRTNGDRCLNACAVRVVCRRVASFVRIYCIEWPVLSVAPSRGWSGANTRPPLNHPRFEPVLLFVQVHISSWISQLCDGHSRVRTVSPKLFV